MTQLSAIIIDDEQHARQNLATLLGSAPRCGRVGDANTIDKGHCLIHNGPDGISGTPQIGEQTALSCSTSKPSISTHLHTTAWQFAIKAGSRYRRRLPAEAAWQTAGRAVEKVVIQPHRESWAAAGSCCIPRSGKAGEGRGAHPGEAVLPFRGQHRAWRAAPTIHFPPR